MTGGSRPTRSEGLIGRGRQLEELAVAISQEKERAEAFGKQLTTLDERGEALRVAGREADERRRQLEIQRISAERDVLEAQKIRRGPPGSSKTSRTDRAPQSGGGSSLRGALQDPRRADHAPWPEG